METPLIVNQGFNHVGARFWVFRYQDWAFTITNTPKKGLVATAPINTRTSSLCKKWDLPGDYNKIYVSAYQMAGRILKEERETNQLTLF